MFSIYDTKELKMPDGSLIDYELIKKYTPTKTIKITHKGHIDNATKLISNHKINLKLGYIMKFDILNKSLVPIKTLLIFTYSDLIDDDLNTPFYQKFNNELLTTS